MTMQRPLLVPDHGGGAEMVEDGVTGLVFHAGDPSSLAEKILALYRDRELGRRLGAAAREKALETFAVESHVRMVQAVYDELLKKG
jgi:glycosyltransferase involved in cell wall biosynthesis